MNTVRSRCNQRSQHPQLKLPSAPGRLVRVLLLLALTGISAMANSIEEPAYALLYNFGTVEIREYEPVIQAVTTLPDNNATGAGFQRLAGFIFGGNSASESIAMTAPVQETLNSGQPVMAFTLPSAYRMDQLPQPNDQRVTLVEVPRRAAAVISFSGWATSGKIEKYSQQLLSALQQQNIATAGEVMLNQYNPPWTPPFMRRNEIMVNVTLPQLSQSSSQRTPDSSDDR